MANMFGVDFGTLNLKIYNRNTNEIHMIRDTVATVNNSEIYAWGDTAYEMYEKSPERIQVSFPVRRGVIADYNNLQNMLMACLEKTCKGRLKGSDFIVAVPPDITEVEKKAFFDLLYKSKIRPKNVLLVDKPLADAVGLGMNVMRPNGVMIVDFGADTTEISVISLGGLVLSDLLHYGSSRLDDSIISYIRKNENMLIGKRTAASLKEKLGCAFEPKGKEVKTAIGLNVVTGLPAQMEISSSQIYAAIKGNIETLCNDIRAVLEKTPPELAKDVVRNGIYLAGGGSKLARLDQLIADHAGIQVNTVQDPEKCAARGLGGIIAEKEYHKLAFSMR